MPSDFASFAFKCSSSLSLDMDFIQWMPFIFFLLAAFSLFPSGVFSVFVDENEIQNAWKKSCIFKQNQDQDEKEEIILDISQRIKEKLGKCQGFFFRCMMVDLAQFLTLLLNVAVLEYYFNGRLLLI